MEITNYKPGAFLKRVTDTYQEIPEYQKVFIHNGYKYSDGLGCLIGFENGKLVHSSEFGNMCFPDNVVEANRQEIEDFMIALMHQDFIKYR